MAHLWPSFFLSSFLLLLPSCYSALTMAATNLKQGSKLETSVQDALFAFKSLISEDPSGVLNSWNNSNHFCQWPGITCSGHRHPGRLAALNLDSLNLAGSISPALSNLTFLQRISLSNNRFHGSIPQELGLLFGLQHLNLSMNSLDGQIPTTLGLCSNLQNISLDFNKFQGAIPLDLCNCSSLQIINLGDNMLRGAIPACFGSLAKLTLIRLHNNSLTGGVASSVSNLSSSLTSLSLSLNSLSGDIPPDIGKLSLLNFLDLSRNGLSGSIPSSLTNLSSMAYLYLSFNNLSGPIPPDIQKLSLLTALDLSRNNLTGSIPDSLGKLSSTLAAIDLSDNNLIGGIPDSLGNLTLMTYLSLQSDFLTGFIPQSLWNLSSLTDFDVASNQLQGIIPLNIGHYLPQLEFLYMYENQFHGTIPASLSNASGLQHLELNVNQLSGRIPPIFGDLPSLSSLILRDNSLEATAADGWKFLATLSNCTNLQSLQLDNNLLAGALPESIANLSATLEELTLSKNQITGRIPPEIGNLRGLGIFHMGLNYLTGNLPASIGMLQSLHTLDLDQNNLDGEIPATIGNLTQLNKLYIDVNSLSGIIPSTLGSCQNLVELNLQNNTLIGGIPAEVFGINSLAYLILSHNSLSGPIPSEVGGLTNLELLDVSQNNLSGEIPTNLGECTVMQYLYLQQNHFDGTIPSSLGTLKGISELDFSSNNLSGPIPEFFEHLNSLYRLNLSFNNLEGEVPRDGVFANLSGISFLGNYKLCGGLPGLELPSCPSNSSGKKHISSTLVVIIAITSASAAIVLLFCLIAGLCWAKKSRQRKHVAETSMSDQHMKISYAELSRATGGFSSANLVGTGSTGSVYKATLADDNNMIVAVKVLNLQQHGALRSFTEECRVLGTLRHRNLVKIITACASVDLKGDDFKAVVFDFMPNGSLERWLHPWMDGQSLKLVQRLNIAIDVAHALEYLHHYGPIPVVHCDLKPSNVLLDDDMVAHVGDFGLARFLKKHDSTSSETLNSSSIGFKGTIGYAPPEYGVAYEVSTRGDVYSYGILVLEMFTGKSPTDAVFVEALTLHDFVLMASPERIMHVVDQHLFLSVEDCCEDERGEEPLMKKDPRRGLHDCLVSILSIGLCCSNESPRKRMEMGEVVRELNAIRDEYFKRWTPLHEGGQTERD